MGSGLRGRMLVEPACCAHFEQLGRRGQAYAPRSAVSGQGRYRAEGHLLLRALSARIRRDVAEIRGWEARELYNDAVSRMVHGETRSSWQEGVGSHLGQRQLAHLQGGQALARGV